MDKNRSYLDVIRGFSTIIIVCFHYSCALAEYNFQGFANYFYHYANNYWGTLGVNLFFLLSGAGLWIGYSKSCEWKTYYKRRWLKIFPMFYLCLLPLYVVNSLFVKKDFFYGGSPVKMLLTLAGMDGYLRSIMNNYYLIGEWFLGVIIILYLLFPFLRRFMLSKASAPFTAVLFILCCIDQRAGFSMIAGRGWLGYYLFVFWLGMLFMKYEQILLQYVKWYICLWPVIVLLVVKLPVPWENDMLSIVLALCIMALCLSFSGIRRQTGIIIENAFPGMPADAHREYAACGVHPVRETNENVNVLLGSCTKIMKLAARYSYAVFLVHHVIIDLFFKVCFPVVHNGNAFFILLFLCMVIYVCAVVLDRLTAAVTKRLKAHFF